jgi:hypothetical protein
MVVGELIGIAISWLFRDCNDALCELFGARGKIQPPSATKGNEQRDSCAISMRGVPLGAFGTKPGHGVVARVRRTPT